MQGGAGARGRSQLDDKTMPWATFAQRCLTTDRFGDGSLTQGDLSALALSLATQTPYMISCCALRAQVADKLLLMSAQHGGLSCQMS